MLWLIALGSVPSPVISTPAWATAVGYVNSTGFVLRP
jgi:hypothetical protein